MNARKLQTFLIGTGFVLGAMMGVSEAQPTGPVTSSAVREIEKVLAEQTKCWNEKNIEGFMNTYWKSERLTFSGGGKTTRGWQATLDRYKTSYPEDKMGRLTIDNQEVTQLGANAALVLGQWHLEAKDEKKDGNFSLVMRKTPAGWKIIHDHSSTREQPAADSKETQSEKSDSPNGVDGLTK